MLQKEVAERIAADPGGKEYGFLSVLVQYAAVPRIEFSVPAGAFTPRPKVDSTVLTLSMRARPINHRERRSAFSARDQSGLFPEAEDPPELTGPAGLSAGRDERGQGRDGDRLGTTRRDPERFRVLPAGEFSGQHAHREHGETAIGTLSKS